MSLREEGAVSEMTLRPSLKTNGFHGHNVRFYKAILEFQNKPRKGLKKYFITKLKKVIAAFLVC